MPLYPCNFSFLVSFQPTSCHSISYHACLPLPAARTEIDWFPGKNLTVRVVKRKAKKGGKNAKMVTKTEPCDSFFNFFSPPVIPTEDDEMDEEEVRDRM